MMREFRLNVSDLHRHLTVALAITVGVAVLLATGGCASQTHAQAKKAAVNRWSAARGGILYGLAMQQFETGDLDKAEKTCKQGVAAQPDNPRFYELMGRVQAERGDLESAYKYFDAAIALNDRSSSAHYHKGILLQRWQRYDEALDAYQKTCETAPDDVNGYLAAAEMLVKLNRSDEALAMLQSKSAYFEHNAALRTAVGRIHMMHHEFGKAVVMFREASLLSPDDMSMLESLALAEYADGQYVEAGYHLKRLLASESHADRNDLRLLQGDCYLASDRKRQAGEVYYQVARADPDNCDAWIRMAQVAWMLDDDKHLRMAAQRALQAAPQRYEGYLLHGIALRRAERQPEAIEQFELASQVAPDSALPLILKGLTLEQSGEYQSAVRAYAQALEVAPEDDRARRLLSNVATNAMQ